MRRILAARVGASSIVAEFGAESFEGDVTPAAMRLRLPTLKILVLCCCHERYRCSFLVIYDFPLAGKPTMIMTNLDATSLSGIRPSGDALERVMPGMLSVVACGRILGV